MDRLARKSETARAILPAPVIEEQEGAEVGLIAYGSSHWAMIEARDQLAAAGVRTSYCLVKALPLHAEVKRFVARHRRLYVVEQNRDAQMAQLVKLESAADAHKVRSVLHYIGLPLDARFVTDAVLKLEAAAAPAAPVPQGATR
jgi:2-oxoglutarate ferredoxin oxidoreductase subunit alpha